MAHEAGKGSARRKEDVSKINENWDRIFNKQKGNDMELDDDECFGIEDDDEYDEECSWCHGCGEGDYDGASCRNCHGTGIEPRDDDYDDI